MIHRLDVNPAILTWARERAGLTPAIAAKRIGFRPSTKCTARDKLVALETGRTQPTHNQLQKISQVYRCPSIAFFMRQPPADERPHTDYRTLPTPLSPEENAALTFLLCDFWTRHDLVKSIVDADAEGDWSLDFVNSATVRDNVRAVAHRIRNLLDITDKEASCSTTRRSTTDLFATVRHRVEQAGVFVILAGNLGPRNAKIDERIFRGFTIADRRASFIVINRHAPRSTWAFTLLSELVHLFLGNTGVSNAPTATKPSTKVVRVERFCNDVAAEILMPRETLQDVPRRLTGHQASRTVGRLAIGRGVANSTAAYRLVRAGRLSRATYQRIDDEEQKRRRSPAKPKQRMIGHAPRHGPPRRADSQVSPANGRKRAREPSSFGATRYRLGLLLTRLVDASLRSNELDHVEAATILGTKTNHVRNVLRATPQTARSRDAVPREV